MCGQDLPDMSTLALEPLSAAQPRVYISGKSLLPMLHTHKHAHTHAHTYTHTHTHASI